MEKPLTALIVVGGVLIAGYLALRYYESSMQNANLGTVSGSAGGISGTLNLGALAGDIGALFGSGSENS